MSLKVLCISDLHFLNTQSELPLWNNRLEYQTKTCEFFAKEIIKRRPDAVVNLGDTNNNHGSIAVDVVQTIGSAIAVIQDACQEVGARQFIMAGNHDQASKDGSVNFVEGYAPARDKISLITREGSSFIIKGNQLSFVPYTYDPDIFFKRLSASRVKRANQFATFIHQDVKQVLWGPGKPATIGLDLPTVTAGYDGWTICGHYHHPQLMQDRKFAIVGSPFYAHWGDSMTKLPRGYMWLDENGPSWTSNPYTPIRHTIRADSLKDVNDWIESLHRLGWWTSTDAKRLLLRVICKDGDTARQITEKLKGHSILKVFMRVDDIKFETEVDNTLVLDVPMDAVKKYMEALIANNQSVSSWTTLEELTEYAMEAMTDGSTKAEAAVSRS